MDFLDIDIFLIHNVLYSISQRRSLLTILYNLLTVLGNNVLAKAVLMRLLHDQTNKPENSNSPDDDCVKFPSMMVIFLT
jgi:hypothetical protein